MGTASGFSFPRFSNAPSRSSPLDSVPTLPMPFSPQLDPHRPASIQVAGMASNCDPKSSTFTLNIDVYSSALKDSKLALKSTQTAPFLCIIRLSTREVMTTKMIFMLSGDYDIVLYHPPVSLCIYSKYLMLLFI